MSDINPTRRADELPARDGAPLAGWPTVITAEEAVALRGALKQLQTALDAVVRERDEARAEIERVRAERDALRAAAREYLETLGGAMKSGKFEMGGSAEMAHFVRQAMQRLDSLVFDREGPRPAGLERLHEPLKKSS